MRYQLESIMLVSSLFLNERGRNYLCFLLLSYKLNFCAQSYLVTHHHTAGLQRGIPVQSPIFSVDLSGYRETSFIISIKVFDLPAILHIEGHLFRDTLDGQ